MTSMELDGLAERIARYFHLFKDYTFLEFDNTEEDVLERIEQLKHDLTDIEAIEDIIFDITDCNKNLDNSYSKEACDLNKLLKEQRTFLERNRDKIMVSDTNYEVKHAIHIGGKEILFAEDKNAENGMCWFVGDYTPNNITGQYTDCIACDDFLEAMQEFSDRVNKQVKVMMAVNKSRLPQIFTAEQCYPNDRGQSIDGKIVAIKVDVLRPEYRHGDVQLVLVSGGNGAKANPYGNAVYCYHLNNGKHTRFERYDIEGEVKPEYVPEWAKEKAAAILAEKGAAQQKQPKEMEAR